MSDTPPTILALDASSTTLGWCLYAGRALAHGEHRIAGADIAVRCATAADILAMLLRQYPEVNAIAIESPVARFAKAVIPQARVSGALMALAAQKWIPVCEVTPTAAKFALAGRGDASKDAMQARARSYGVVGEHASDALAVALVAAKLVSVVEEAVS